ncbi:MAG: hypothetical protein ED859_06220 [Desulfuromonadales bacterium]|nr:MAG: hypothetical protein ED859_06220 [Desulfuromonadales bacterium]
MNNASKIGLSSPFIARIRRIVGVALLVSCVPMIVEKHDCPASTGARESRYDIFSHGLRVGDLTTLLSHDTYQDRRALRFESNTRVMADLLVYSIAYESRETALVTEDGTVSYKRSDRRRGQNLEAAGRLERGKFIIDVTENGSRRTLLFDRSRYDHTTMECPEILILREGEEMSLRLLDFETFSIVTRRYRWMKSEDVLVEGKPVRCRVIDFEDPHKKGRRWIKADDLGVIIARQDGKGKEGSYSLRMTRLGG